MVFILDGNSDHVAQAWRNIGHFGEFVIAINLIKFSKTDFTSYVRGYFWVTIYYAYHVVCLHYGDSPGDWRGMEHLNRRRREELEWKKKDKDTLFYVDRAYSEMRKVGNSPLRIKKGESGRAKEGKNCKNSPLPDWIRIFQENIFPSQTLYLKTPILKLFCRKNIYVLFKIWTFIQNRINTSIIF